MEKSEKGLFRAPKSSELEFFEREYIDKLEPELFKIGEKYNNMACFRLHSVEYSRTDNLSSLYFVTFRVVVGLYTSFCNCADLYEDLSNIPCFPLSLIEVHPFDRLVLKFKTFYREEELKVVC